MWWWLYSSWVSATFTTTGITTPINYEVLLLLLLSTISWDAVTGAQYYIYSTRIIGYTCRYCTTTSTSVSLTGLLLIRMLSYVIELRLYVMLLVLTCYSGTETFIIPACGLSITVQRLMLLRMVLLMVLLVLV